MSKKYKCGCPVGTPTIYRNKEGRIVTTGSMLATSIQCRGCGHITKV